MRQGITVQVSEGDRVRLAAIVADRNSRQKHVWRTRIVMTADGVGTTRIMRQTGKSKVTVWRWQERFMAQGVDGPLRDKSRPSRIPAAGGDGAQAHGCADADRSSGRGDPLDGPNDGQTGRDQCQLGAADLAHPWAPAASRASVQAVARPPIRHQAA